MGEREEVDGNTLVNLLELIDAAVGAGRKKKKTRHAAEKSKPKPFLQVLYEEVLWLNTWLSAPQW